MNNAQLRAFHAVTEVGRFTRAAKAFHVTQPTLSGQVKALEEADGTKLLDRREAASSLSRARVFGAQMILALRRDPR